VLNTAGLSLEQAPPIGVPLRFFLTAPWFAAAAGLLLAWGGADLLVTRWAPATLAAVHLLGLGFLGLVIAGATFQLLPVLVGAPVPAVGLVSRLVYGLFCAGTATLATGFYVSSLPLQLAALALLGPGVAVLVVATLLALKRAKGSPDTVQAIGLSSLGLVIAAVLAATILFAFDARVGLLSLPAWVDLHLSWALVGWAGVLLVAVGVHLVPLFHVTPSYPRWFRHWAPVALFTLVLLATLAHALDDIVLRAVASGAAMLVLSAFAVLTLRFQSLRRRPVWDATLSFWWTGLGALLAASGAWLFGLPATVIGALALAGAAVAIPSGVLYKIVPFLAWFHLQGALMASGRLDKTAPHMKSFVPDAAAHAHFAVYATGFGLLVAALLGLETAAHAAGLAYAVASVMQGVTLLRGYRRYCAELG
jgi:hypothetical protein